MFDLEEVREALNGTYDLLVTPGKDFFIITLNQDKEILSILSVIKQNICKTL
jgi:hypothetical protein